jgi:hypothetical protein
LVDEKLVGPLIKLTAQVATNLGGAARGAVGRTFLPQGRSHRGAYRLALGRDEGRDVVDGRRVVVPF